MSTSFIPAKIELKLGSNILELSYDEGCFTLEAEFLRVNSPSAEVRGHGKPVLQYGKKDIRLLKVEPAGNYALKIIFDDGHDSGLYNWEYLHELCINKESIWRRYLANLEAAGLRRN